MNTLTVVFTGLVFYATPSDPKFTNAVLVTGNSPYEHHSAKLVIPADANVDVTVGGAPSDKRNWALGSSSWVIVAAGKITPGRKPAFVAHVPSVGKALVSAYPTEPKKWGTLAPCTYAEIAGAECDNQQGRVQLSGGTLKPSDLLVIACSSGPAPKNSQR